MIPVDSPLFATAGTFPLDGDDWEGDPVRVDPSAPRRAEGFEPDTLPAEWLNHMLGTHGDWLDYLAKRETAKSLGNWTERSLSSAAITAISTRPPGLGLAGSVPPLTVDHALAIVDTGAPPYNIYASSDGTTWTNSSSGLAADSLGGVGFMTNSSQWVAVGTITGSGGVIYSRTGGNLLTSWGVVQGPAGADYTGVACSDGLAVAVGASGRIATSPDGTTWTNRTAFGFDPDDIAFGGGSFVVVGPTQIRTSGDGSAWTVRDPIVGSAGTAPSRVTYDTTRNRFFIFQHTNSVPRLYSMDAATFAITTLSITQIVDDIACLNGVLALARTHHIRYSIDGGLTFTPVYVARPDITSPRLGASVNLSCFFLGGVQTGGGYISQSLRGV